MSFRPILVKGSFPVEVTSIRDDGVLWYVVTSSVHPGLFLAGKDLDGLIEESKEAIPLLMKLDRDDEREAQRMPGNLRNNRGSEVE